MFFFGSRAFYLSVITVLSLIFLSCGSAGVEGAEGGTGQESSWQGSQLVSDESFRVIEFVHAAIDAEGNAIATWSQLDKNGVWQLWANQYQYGRGWLNPVQVNQNNGYDSGNAKVAISNDGDSIVVWSQFTDGEVSVWARRYEKKTGWQASLLLENENDNPIRYPSVAMDGKGNAIAVWGQVDGGSISFYARRFVKGYGWENSDLLASVDSGFLYPPQVAMNEAGTAVVFWSAYTDTGHRPFAKIYYPGFGWQAVTQIDGTVDTSSEERYCSTAIDDDDNVLCIWVGRDNALYAARYLSGTGWFSAQQIGTNAIFPRVSFNSHGDAVVVWSNNGGSRYDSYMVRRESCALPAGESPARVSAEAPGS